MATSLADLVRSGREKRRDARHRALHGYARRVLAAFAPSGAPDTATDRSGDLPARRLPEPLTAREVEVLGLMAAGLSNPEIATRLYIGVGTVKTHVNRLFAKLAAESRTQAVARARALHLLAE